MSNDNNIIDLSKAKKRKARRTLEKANAKKNRETKQAYLGSKGGGQGFGGSGGKPGWVAYLQFGVLLFLIAYAMNQCGVN